MPLEPLLRITRLWSVYFLDERLSEPPLGIDIHGRVISRNDALNYFHLATVRKTVDGREHFIWGLDTVSNADSQAQICRKDLFSHSLRQVEAPADLLRHEMSERTLRTA